MSEQEELEQIYAEAHADGIVLYEYNEMCSAGDLRDYEYLFEVTDTDDREQFHQALLGSLGTVVDLSFPGSGETRPEALRDAIKKFKEQRDKDVYPRITEVRRRAGLSTEGEQSELGTF